tara:strand:- start:1268 stop:2113 length:846 start_codon:yes stop_codon:yes gene_type:complete
VNKFFFLLPLYNDWESFALICGKINNELKKLEKVGEIFVVNDNSSVKPAVLPNFTNIQYIKILNLNENLGSQKAISIGLQYLKKMNKTAIITILDSDGEDDVTKIPEMIEAAEKNQDKVIVSSRTKRQENFFFKILYFSHKLLTFIFTLNWISYGNYSSFHSNQLKKILTNKNSWLALSACIAKNSEIIKIKAERKKRLIGTSKLSFKGLIFHSLRVNAVFILRSLFISLTYISILIFLIKFGFQSMVYIILFIILYNLLLLITLISNNQKKFSYFENYII